MRIELKLMHTNCEKYMGANPHHMRAEKTMAMNTGKYRCPDCGAAVYVQVSVTNKEENSAERA